MFAYPVKVRPDGGGYLVTFRDIPEAISGGATQQEALDMARDALITAMDFYFEDKRQVPVPSAAVDDEVLVELPASLAAKILLLNEMIIQKVRPIDLAKKMSIERQEVTRFLKLDHVTKIDNLAAAFKALGKKLEISVV